MASYRRLPNRKWQAEVLLPTRLRNGRQRRVTKTHPAKTVVREWATKLEAQIDAGTYVDPRGGDVILRDFYGEWVEHRDGLVADATVAKDRSQWRNHVEPTFGGHPLQTITAPMVRGWLKDMTRQCARCRQTPGTKADGTLRPHRTVKGNTCKAAGTAPGLGAYTVQAAVATLSSLLAAAVRDGLITVNPALNLQLPRADAKPVFFWTKEQAALIAYAADSVSHLMIELDMFTGLRLGELLGLRRRYVDLDSELIAVVGVQTRTGWREWPKSKMSRRTVPIPAHLTHALRVRCLNLGPDDYLFPAPEGGPWDDTNFRKRVFAPAVVKAQVPRGTPHDMRHTAASWLVQAGVDLYRVQALLGHESFTTTQRYAHLAPDAFDTIRDAWGTTS